MNGSILGSSLLSLRRVHAMSRWGRALQSRGLAVLAALLLSVPAAGVSAQTAVTNAARVANPAGLTCSDVAANPTCTRTAAVTTLVVPSGVPAVDFCPVGVPKPVFSIVNGVRISRYVPGAANDAFVPELDFPVAGDLNGLMVDPVRNRLLFLSRAGANTILWAYDAGNGGWYQAATPFASNDLPRAGMTPAGIGYLIAGNNQTPQVWRVTPDAAPGSFGYTVQNIGNLAYDVPPTNTSSGDIAFDGEGQGWLSAGQDLYSIDFAAGLQAVRQARPLLNGVPSTINWAGVAFADDGRLFVADNSGASRYYAYDPATGALTPAAPTVAVGSRDLASCAFPIQAQPELSVVKTLAAINGTPAAAGATVQAADVVTYAITIANAGGAVGTLFPGEVVETLPANTSVVTAGNAFTCTGSTCTNTAAVNVPAGGSTTLAFVVRVADPLPAGVTEIANAVTVAGVDCALAPNDCTEVTPVGPAVSVAKVSDPASGTAVAPGATLTYTVTTTVANAPTSAPVVLTDTLGDGLSFVAVVSAGGYTCNAANPLVCTLPAGTAPGSYPLVYTATVDADAATSVSNAVVPTGDDAPTCAPGSCSTTHPIQSGVVVTKTSDPAAGTQVSPADTLTYTLTATVSGAPLTQVLTLVDTLGNGLTFGAVTAPGAFTCSGNLTCTLPVGTVPGTYAVRYTATVDADASGTVGNNVLASNPPGGDPDPVCTTCSTEHPVVLPAVSVVKTAAPASGTEVAPGDTVAYTLSVTVADAATNEVLTLADTLGEGLTFGVVTAPGAFTCSGGLLCTLPAGTLPGTYAVTYTATVDADATGTVGNSVVASNPPGGDPDPVCTTCNTEHPVTASSATVVKSANPASGTVVLPGQSIAYTLTVTVAGSATTQALSLVDTLDAGLTFGAVTAPGAFTCTGGLTCTLPAGTLPGSYAVTYTATVDADATGTVGNSVVASNPPGGDPDPVCTTCTTEHPVVDASISVSKTADPASGSTVTPGQTIAYTLIVAVADSATTQVVTLADTLGDGLTFGAVTAPGVFTCSGGLVCTLPAGTLPGSYAVTYTATVDADATGTVGNSVVASNPPGGDPDPVCTTCTTEHPVVASAVSVVKTSDPASGTEVAPGDSLAYTLTVTVANSATTQVVTLVDTLGNGLTFGAVTAPGVFTCSGGLTCTLPAGTLPGSYAVSYTATVDADATGTVGNSVVARNPPGGDPDPVCTTCTTDHPVIASAVSVVKSSEPASGAEVAPGDTVTYTLTATVANSATTQVVTLVDTLGDGLTFGTVTAPGVFACSGGLTCTLPAGTLPGVYAVSYTATVDADATGTVGNSVVASNPPGGDPDPVCTTCTTEHPVVATVVTVAKSVALPAGNVDGRVRPGDTLSFTLRVVVAESATTAPVVLTDTPGAGLTFGSVTSTPTGFTCVGGEPLVCTVPASTLPGSYDIVYTATVDADATGSVRNAVIATGPDAPTCAGTCETETPIADPRVTFAKTADPVAGEAVAPGDSIRYTLEVTVSESATTADVVLTDTLGQGLTVAVLPAGCSAAGQVITCILGTGALPGRYTFDYTATVDAAATLSVANAVSASGGGGEAPECAGSCRTEHTIVAPVVTVDKASDPASGTSVRAGDVVTYTVTVRIANSAITAPVVLVDTLQGAHVLLADSVQAPAGGSCSVVAGGLECTLAAGTLPGNHAFVYRTQVAPGASGTVGNAVVASGGGTGTTPDCTSCSTSHPIAEPVVAVAKRSDPGTGAQVAVGETITYTLEVTVSDAATRSDVVLTDTPDAGLTTGALPAGCSRSGGAITCVLPAGSVPGIYAFAYAATVNANAGGAVDNVVVPIGGGSGNTPPACVACATTHSVADTAQLRIVKTAAVRQVRIGDLVRYTLRVENVGTTNVRDARIVDTAAVGFTFVEGSLAVVDVDNAGTVTGFNPVRFDGIDIDAGEVATLTYLMRVGAGVRAGTHVNQAQAQSADGTVISNVATADVQSASDPLLDESLVFGTVFDDRDGDGWQDSAAISGLQVQGGFDAAHYIAGSTTIDRGHGPEPVADASAPLLHGMALGALSARQSAGDPAANHQLVIRQHLREATFTGDFVLRNDQGVTVRMDAAGSTTVERSGEAAKGLNAAAPTVERRVVPTDGGYVVDYVIRNDGIDDRGIPGVRIASVEGLLMETDQFGRYHLAGIDGGVWERGRNFILKVDPSTLPAGAVFTTDNPRLRRVTPGLPARFDFGVTLPVEELGGALREFDLELGELPFAPGSAVLDARHLPTLDAIAMRIADYEGGEVVIRADGGSEGLALDRAEAVKSALLAKLPEALARNVRVVARGDLDDPSSLVAGAGEGGPLLGTVLFDTDAATVKPAFARLLDRVAASLEARGGGVVAIVGHADRRASDAHNTALGLRRARAVYDAIASRLSPEVRARVRVDTSNDPAAPAGTRRK